ncbi:MAG: hypothetical protein RL277_2624 [Planctomycetota bacterium]
MLSHALLLLATLAQPLQDGRQAFDALLRRLDKDLDGRISRTEFAGRAVAFRRMDRDGDGFLSAKDLPAGKETAPSGNDAPANEPAATQEGLDFFESRIRPLLIQNCYSCHSTESGKIKGGLRLDSRGALLAGGSSGPVIVPGDVEASLLIKAVRYEDADFAMPPKQALSKDAVRDLERWVEMGAPWTPSVKTSEPAAAPATEYAPMDYAKAREFWSFRPPVQPEIPRHDNDKWSWSDTDRFLFDAMKELGVSPVGDADKRTWLRRVTLDLTGLPPTPEELAAFERDNSTGAYAAAVDRLLASPAYGERWGRHWLDVARYGESSGKETNILYPHAWRYRDYVIQSFREDKPYNRFVEEQLAGDLLQAANADQRAEFDIATGYLALGTKSHNTRDRRQFMLDVADEQIDAFSQGILGMTVSCARCHDHKFDPIPTKDYYALAGIFLSTETLYGTHRSNGNDYPSKLIEIAEEAKLPNGPTMPVATRAIVQRIIDQLERREERTEAPRTGADGKADPIANVVRRAQIQQRELLEELLARFDAQGNALESNRLAMGVREGAPRDIAVLNRGELDKPGDIAPRGFPQVLTPQGSPKIAAGSGRAELARWVVSPENPLTARVWVNRVWLHLFGTGLVTTPDNFGHSGQMPTHPELLDHLALQFMQQGWSTKRLVRELVLSHAYRLAAVHDAAHAAKDPDLLTLWRYPERRLEAEVIRDSILAVAGRLQDAPVGSGAGYLEGPMRNELILEAVTGERPIRSIYLPILRDRLPEALSVFDGADPSFVTGDRDETHVATQALFLMNDPDVMASADAFAERLIREVPDESLRIQRAFELALGRKPTEGEQRAVESYLRQQSAAPEKSGAQGRTRRRGAGLPEPVSNSTDPRVLVWSSFVQTLFACAEFRFLG